MEEGRFLGDTDLVRIEFNNSKLDLAKVKIEKKHLTGQYNELAMSAHGKDIEILKLRNELLKIEIKEMRDSAEAVKNENKKFMLSLREKYDLPERWGFNPESGEIILEE